MKNVTDLHYKGSQGAVTIEDGIAPPSPRVSRRVRLQTVGDVSYELAKLYREARSGKIDVGDASRLANMLSILSRILQNGPEHCISPAAIVVVSANDRTL